MAIVAVFAGVIGAALGSFVNVCAYRIPRGISSVTPRSSCPSCSAKLRWFELIPLLSQIIQRGRCRHCGMWIPIRYLLVELLCGVISVLLLIRYGVSFEWAYWTAFSLILVLIAMIDYTHLLIPNKVIVAGAVLLTPLKALMDSPVLTDAAFAGGLMAVAYVFVRGVSYLLKKQAMGMGDVKLMGLIAFALGWQETLIAIWVSAIIGSVIGGALILTRRQSTELKLPFGTMLASVCLLLIPIENDLKGWIADWLI